MATNRKDDHIRLGLEEKIESNDFDTITIDHLSLPKFNLNDVNLETEFLGKKIPVPIYINAMTGGSENAKNINMKLALYAKTFNLPIVIGSQSSALKNTNLVDTYRIVRTINPQGFLVANLSANASLHDAKQAITMINADALSIHLNVIQELVMTEGDREFVDWRENIKKISENIKTPLLIKEVGFGMSKETITTLENLGVKFIDVSGTGGTNFARIERKRTQSTNMTFENLGISTVDSLLNAQDTKMKVYASGGIRNALDIFKALMLGAEAVGLSRFFLQLIKEKDEIALKKIEELITDLRKCFLIFGVKNIAELKRK